MDNQEESELFTNIIRSRMILKQHANECGDILKMKDEALIPM